MPPWGRNCPPEHYTYPCKNITLPLRPQHPPRGCTFPSRVAIRLHRLPWVYNRPYRTAPTPTGRPFRRRVVPVTAGLRFPTRTGPRKVAPATAGMQLPCKAAHPPSPSHLSPGLPLPPKSRSGAQPERRGTSVQSRRCRRASRGAAARPVPPLRRGRDRTHRLARRRRW